MSLVTKSKNYPEGIPSEQTIYTYYGIQKRKSTKTIVFKDHDWSGFSRYHS